MDSPESTVRFSLDLTVEAHQKLENLTRRIGGTKSETLRKALALLLAVQDAREAGKRVGCAAPGQPLETEFVGL